MMHGSTTSLRIAVVGGGPAGSFFALYALKYAESAGRDVEVTIYEGKDFRHFGQPGCNMCAGLVPISVVHEFADLGLAVPPALVLNRIGTYSLHTSAGSLNATQPDPEAQVISVFRGAGPRRGHLPHLVSFDELLIEQAIARGATVRRWPVETIRRGPPVEVVSRGETGRYDLVVLAAGVNGYGLTLQGFGYRPPPVATMCQSELHLGRDEVTDRLGSSVHIFLPPDEIATYGILIPKGSHVTVCVLHPRRQILSLRQFLELDQVRSVVGTHMPPVCGCLPRIPTGLATGFVDDGFVAIGDASAARLYKNGIGSALRTARQAAWTAVHVGYGQADFATHYVPLCRTIDHDNLIGRLLFLQVPALKHFGVLPKAHYRLASGAQRFPGAAELHSRILWGMFTGAYSYRDLLKMTLNPRLGVELLLALGHAMIQHGQAALARRRTA